MDESSSQEKNKKARLEKIGVALFFILISIGFFSGYYFAQVTTAKLKNALQVKALTIASFINPGDIEFLNGDPSDIDNQKYQDLKARLVEAHSYNGEINYIYILGKKPDGNLFYYIDSEAQNSKRYTYPGSLYKAIDMNEAVLFDQGSAYVKGPYSSDNEKWFTAYASIYNPKTNLPIAKVGIDSSAEEYDQTWNSVFFSTFSIGFFVALIVLLFTIYLKSIIHILRRGASELALVKNQKKVIEESNAKVGLGYFKWNRTTGDLVLSDSLATSLNLDPSTSFLVFKNHILGDEVNNFETSIIDACSKGESSLAYEINFNLSDGSVKRLRFNCSFSQVYQNNPKFIEGTILQV